eukprot:CAMPEP_0119339080 /NCGR_PEP_ID=MMETSP1333-20130426/97541_1 /TAXON_ID=418940 /ORGANISM="Scyphosphaera apsteinii, Strain RCC1455" /LENGTH=44 /DNA_ID= /DNA_START= /DNA_END= /DNA_ORIENTATION=
MSHTLSLPVENAMALGAVDTGSKKVTEQPNTVGSRKRKGLTAAV